MNLIFREPEQFESEEALMRAVQALSQGDHEWVFAPGHDLRTRLGGIWVYDEDYEYVGRF